MPLDISGLVGELEGRGEVLRELEAESESVAEGYREVLLGLDPSRPGDTEGLGEWPGAVVEEPGPLFHGFSSSASSGYLKDTLVGREVCAVDGSQVVPDRSFDVPVAVAQAASVSNLYGSGQEVERRLEVLPKPGGEGVGSGDPFSERAVKTERDILELGAAEDAVREGHDLVLFDNGLLPNFVNYLPDEVRGRYVEALISLLVASEEEGVPVVGYLDNSKATDLLRMVRHVRAGGEPEEGEEEKAPFLTDARLLADLLPEGGRTKVFRLRRPDVGGDVGERENLLEEYGRGGYGGGIGLCYLDLGGESPKRLEFPLWVWEEGLVGEVVGLVRAEAMRGERYPHVLKEAHDAAVVRRREAEDAYRMFERYVERRDSDKETVKEMGRR